MVSFGMTLIIDDYIICRMMVLICYWRWHWPFNNYLSRAVSYRIVPCRVARAVRCLSTTVSIKTKKQASMEPTLKKNLWRGILIEEFY